LAKKKVVYRYRKAKKKKVVHKDKRMPILALAGLAVPFIKPVQNAIAGDYEGALAEIGARFTGYNYQSQVFDPKYALMNGYLPIVAGALGSKVATKLGVPFIGNYIKL